MPRFYFDLHAGGLSEWDDDGRDAENADEAILLANDILRLAICDNRRLMGDRHAVIVIRNGGGHQIATATGNRDGQAQVHRAAPDGELAYSLDP
jgi:hypothetical protein